MATKTKRAAMSGAAIIIVRIISPTIANVSRGPVVLAVDGDHRQHDQVSEDESKDAGEAGADHETAASGTLPTEDTKLRTAISGPTTTFSTAPRTPPVRSRKRPLEKLSSSWAMKPAGRTSRPSKRSLAGRAGLALLSR
jgi:hypothetical protein